MFHYGALPRLDEEWTTAGIEAFAKLTKYYEMLHSLFFFLLLASHWRTFLRLTSLDMCGTISVTLFSTLMHLASPYHSLRLVAPTVEHLRIAQKLCTKLKSLAIHSAATLIIKTTFDGDHVIALDAWEGVMAALYCSCTIKRCRYCSSEQ